METIEKNYNELVSKNDTWVNPVLRTFGNPLLNQSYFIVDIVDFEEIVSLPYVRIVYISKHTTSVCGQFFSIYCQLL
jgi:hypothetical protein